MIRLLLNAVAPMADETVTRFGGLPLIPRGAEFQWPECSTCRGAMQFLGQIALDDSSTNRLALIFMCQNDPGLCDEWDANLGGNCALVVPIVGDGRLAEAPETGVTTRGSVYGSRVEAVDSVSYDDARERWVEGNRSAERQILGMLGGEPSWLQGDETPICDHCEICCSTGGRARPQIRDELRARGPRLPLPLLLPERVRQISLATLVAPWPLLRLQEAAIGLVTVESPIRKQLSFGVRSRLDANALSKDAIRSNPAVDSTAIIADLEPFATNGLHEVEIFGTSHSAEHDVSDR
jgi:hypothetical protein